jgi:serine/threonine-protein kinase
VTAKADIYALGCVLYEMLTAEPPFNGPTAQAIIARVMTEEPRSLTLQRRTIPPHVEAAVVTALAKLPADRFASAAQFSAALGNAAYTTTTATRGAAVAARSPRSQAAAVLPWVLLAATTAGLAWALLGPKPAAVPAPVTRFSFGYEVNGRIGDGAGSPIAVSPDGSRIVYIGTDSARAQWLYSRSLDREEPVQIAGTLGAAGPFFSPDGTTLGFTQDGKLRRVGLGGGAVVTICECGSLSASWGPGNVVYLGRNSLFRVSDAGGNPELVAAPDTSKGESFRWLDALPDGRGVLLTLVRGGTPTLAAVSLPDGKLHELGQAGMYPRWVEGGFVAFLQQDGTLFAVPFDSKAMRLSGTPVPITDRVRSGPAFPGKLGVARTGTVAYLGGTTAGRELVLADRAGRLTILPLPERIYDRPRFSPDGQRLGVQVVDFASRTTSDLWVYDLRAGNLSRITFDSSSATPSWMPDGRHLVYVNRGGTLFRIAIDGSGVAESLFARPAATVGELQVTPDGKRLILRDSDARTRRDIWVVSLDSAYAARPLLRTPFEERGIALSPDGNWLAYVSNESGTDEVYVRRLEEGSGRWKVTRVGGTEPRWGALGPEGRELLYRVTDTVFAVTLQPGPEPRFTVPKPVVVGTFATDRNAVTWDVSPDGQRFAFTRNRGTAGMPTMTVLLHWFDRLRAAPK